MDGADRSRTHHQSPENRKVGGSTPPLATTSDAMKETPRTSYRVAIEKFLKPAVGETSLTRLAQLGRRPFEQLYAELRVAGGAARAGRSSSTGVSGA
jgi:hypothetical protein